MRTDADVAIVTPRWRDPLSVAFEVHRAYLLRRLRRTSRPRR